MKQQWSRDNSGAGPNPGDFSYKVKSEKPVPWLAKVNVHDELFLFCVGKKREAFLRVMGGSPPLRSRPSSAVRMAGPPLASSAHPRTR
jgi:hypothetical protein